MVITPSLPTASSAWLMRSPISSSREAIVPTWAMALPSTGVAFSLRNSETRSAAFEMPLPSAVGFAPAATLRRPAATMAWASTVAVVVPSPATSLVFVAAVLASCAPRFSNGSLSSISRAIVTPSLVTVGPPNFFSSTTLRPRGPRVTLTASASWSTPRSSARRAVSSKLICFGMSPLSQGQEKTPPRQPVRSTGRRGGGSPLRAPAVRPGRRGLRATGCASVDDGQHVAGGEDEVLLAVVLDLGAAVLAVDDDVADGHVERHAVALVVDAARAHREDLALLGLLLRRVGDDDARRRGGLGLAGLDDDLVLERLDVRHLMTSPSLGCVRCPDVMACREQPVRQRPVVAGAGTPGRALTPSPSQPCRFARTLRSDDTNTLR